MAERLLDQVNLNELTPMMQQYMETKKKYLDCILFYRLGDFYEMFYDDALIASKELELTLTGKSCGTQERAPMCGVPFHAADNYITRLVERGYHVAVCEQMEDPKLAKGIVKREVIKIVTPGTNLNMQALDETKNNYLMCVICQEKMHGISIVDISTGDYYVTEVESVKKVLDEIYKFSPAEIICNPAFMQSEINVTDLKERYRIAVSELADWYYDRETVTRVLQEHFSVSGLSGLGLSDYPTGTLAAGAVLQYLFETQKSTLDSLTHITPYITSKYMVLDTATRRNLELTETIREKAKRGSLLWVLDKTKTAMGARLLRNYVEQPLIDETQINDRYDVIEELNQQMITREELREYLNSIYDLERLMGKISYKTANPRDLIAFASSLSMLPPMKYLLSSFESKEICSIQEDMDAMEDLYRLVNSAIVEEPPINTKEGGIIKEGYHPDVDELRRAKTEGKDWLAKLETTERERTGIKNLKIKFNRVFGYYLEVTNSFKNLVPGEWIRKQTLANAERYTTPELKELEDKILNAEDKLIALE